MLCFVGLGLYDEHSITIEGRNAIQRADVVYAEFYTSVLTGASLGDLECFHEKSINVLDREAIEQNPDPIFNKAQSQSVALVTAGDPMISTTHVDLRLRAQQHGISTRAIHGTSAQTAACGLSGLQNYRFGKATTIPFPGTIGSDPVPNSVISTINENKSHGLHTIAYLDIKSESEDYLDAATAAAMLKSYYRNTLAVVIARAGSENPVVKADTLEELSEQAFGPPLHLLIIPGDLHEIEADALETFANAPSSLTTT